VSRLWRGNSVAAVAPIDLHLARATWVSMMSRQLPR
jgi:hypothetical protein